MKILLLTSLLIFSFGCRKKKSEDESTSLFGSTSAVVVAGSQPARGTQTVVGSNGIIKVIATDGAGKVLYPPPTSFRILDPDTSGVSRPLISWTSSENADTYDLFISPTKNCKNPILETRNLSGLTFLVSQDLANGIFHICITARNTVGATKAANSGKFTMAVTIPNSPSIPPEVSLNNSPEFINSINQNEFDVSGTCNFGPILVFAENFAGTQVAKSSECTSGKYSAALNLSGFADGTLTIAATNDTVTVANAVVKDSTPAIVIAPADDPSPRKSKVWNWGCSDASCSYRHLVNTNPTSDPTGEFTTVNSTVENSGNGTAYIHIQALDIAGNISATTHSSTLMDTIAPVIAIMTSPPVLPANLTNYALDGTCDELSGTIDWAIDDNGNGATPAVSGTVNCDGTNWAKSGINLGTLDQGSLSISLELSDQAGNTGSTSGNVVKDTVAPLLGITSAPTVNALNVGDYSFSGTCNENGILVYWTIDDVGNGATAAANGSVLCDGTIWSQANLNLSIYSEGTLNFTANLDDSYGNSATEQTASATKNTTAPSLNLSSPNPVNSSNVSTYAIGGSCDVNTATVNWNIDDQGDAGTAAVTGSTTCNGTNWTATTINLSALNEGTLVFTVNMDDLESNSAPTETANTEKDVDRPTVNFSSSPIINFANKGNYTLSGSCSESSGTVNWVIKDQDVGTADISGQAPCDGTNWTKNGIVASTLTDSGTIDVTVNLSDTAGNTAIEATASTSMDTENPTAAADSIDNIGPINQAAFVFTGTCSENTRNVTLSVDDQADAGTTAMAGSDSCDTLMWSITLNLSTLNTGTIDIVLDHTDASGNSVQVLLTTVKDMTPPSVPNIFVLNSPVSSYSKDPNPELRFSSLTIGETIRVWSNAGCTTEVGSATSLTGSLDITIPLTLDGDYDYWATSEDSLENRSICSTTTINFTLDRVITEITAVEVAGETVVLSNDPTPSVTVSGIVAEDTVRLYTSGDCFASEQVGFGVSTGTSISIQIESNKFTTDQLFTIYARSNDLAENYSTCSTQKTEYTLDTEAPSKPSSVALYDPVVQPGTDTTPTFRIGGLVIGNPVSLYSDSNCSTPMGSGSALGATLDLDTTPLTLDGTYTIYATTTDLAGNRSDCSTETDSYTLDISVPTLTSVHIEGSGGLNVVAVGGEAKVTFIASEPLATSSVLIDGNATSIINPSGTTYIASYKMLNTDTAGTLLFEINFSDQASNVGIAVTLVTDGSSLTFDDTKNSPEFSVVDQTASEQVPFSLDVNDANQGNDTDLDGQNISYSCFYDTTINNSVNPSQPCTDLTGFSFDTNSGEISWTSSYSSAGLYELRIIGSDGVYAGEDTLTLTVNDTNRAPVLGSTPNQTFDLADTFSFDMYEMSTSADTDADGDILTYTCYYDTVIDGSVAEVTECGDLDGVDFTAFNGYFSWTVQPTTPGDFEFKVVASDGIDTGFDIWSAVVTIDISRLPQLCMVGTNITSYFASLNDENDVTLNGQPIGGGALPTIYSAGDTFTALTSEGDLLECSGGCFVITPTEGTAAWTTQSYSGTLLSTYIGRGTNAKFVVAAFDQEAQIQIKQDGVTHVLTTTVPANSIRVFAGVQPSLSALWIESDAPISAYVSSSTDTAYDRDGRIITVAARESLAFVSGGGGTPSGITTTIDNTLVSAYRNDGTNYIDQTIDVIDVLTVTHTSATQNAIESAISIYSDQPTVATQHADGDGFNATPSLPKSMLSTHFVAPMDGDYASFASYEEGEVLIIDGSDTVVGRYQMVKDASAHAKAPYAYSYNPTLIPQGTKLVCTTNCVGIFEPDLNDDETLMTGTELSPITLISADFNEGDTIASNFVGRGAAECTGENDFPSLAWDSLPWGTKYIAIIVEDLDAGNFVHLNLVDVDASLMNIPMREGIAGVVTFPSGTQGTNGYATSGWSGPCDSSVTHNYQFKIFAMSEAIGSAVNNKTADAFEALYQSTILGAATINAGYGP